MADAASPSLPVPRTGAVLAGLAGVIVALGIATLLVVPRMEGRFTGSPVVVPTCLQCHDALFETVTGPAAARR